MTSFQKAADEINEAWGAAYDARQIQRWGEHIGAQVQAQREAERQAYRHNQRPTGPANDAALLVIGLDGGRLQERTKDPQTQSHWREDKVATLSTYRIDPAKGPEQEPRPVRLVSSYVATMDPAERFGELARIEAERRGVRQAREVVVIGDGAPWIDGIFERHFSAHTRILDYYHVFERLCACAKALYPSAERRRRRLEKRLEAWLHGGRIALILRWLEKAIKLVGPARPDDPPEAARQILPQQLRYLALRRAQMDYPSYRARGWPVGSGVTEAGVKQFNKRVKGTEQFWSRHGDQAILALRALYLSEDDRWNHYWLYGRPLRAAA